MHADAEPETVCESTYPNLTPSGWYSYTQFSLAHQFVTRTLCTITTASMDTPLRNLIGHVFELPRDSNTKSNPNFETRI